MTGQLAFKNQTVRQTATRTPPPSASPPAVYAFRSAPLVQRKSACACGGGCPRCAQKSAAASKYQISTPGDSYEQEADRVADAVMSPAPPADAPPPATSSAAPSVQRKCGGGCGGASPVLMLGEEEEQKLLQPKGEAGRAPPPAAEAETKIDDTQGGQPLGAAERDFFEPRFGQDFGGVRVHADERAAEAAQSVNAQAYTLGRDIYFGAGRYRPDTSEGRHLMAHELAHVVQQGGSAARISRREAGAAPALTVGASPPHISTNAPRHVQRGEVARCNVPSMTDNAIGMAAHTVIQSWCASQYPFCFSEVAIPGGAVGGGGGTGFSDLVHTRPGSTLIEIGEVKPVSQAQNVDPYLQLAGYITAYQASHSHNQVIPMTGWAPQSPPNGVTPFFPPPGQLQFLNCSTSTNGVYFYWCTRTRMPRPPVPVRVPDEVWERVRERIRQMRDRTGDIGEPVPEPTRVPKWVWAVVAVAAAIAVVALAIALLPAEIVAGIGAALLTLGRILLGAAPRLAGFLGAFGFGMGAASASTGEGSGEGAAEGTGGQGQQQGAGTQGGSQTQGPGGQGQTPGTGTTPGEGGTSTTTPQPGGTPGEGPSTGTSAEQAVNDLANVDPGSVQGSPQDAQAALDQAAPALQGVQGAASGTGTPATGTGTTGTGTPGAGTPATGPTAEISREAAQVSTAVDSARREAATRAGTSSTGTTSTPGTPTTTAAGGGSPAGQPGQGPGEEGGAAGPLPSSEPSTTYAPASTIPEGQRARTDFGIWIMSGMDRNAVVGRTYTAVVRIELDPPFTVPVLFRVESKQGSRVVLTVVRAWYVAERNVGSPVGARYTYTFPSSRR